MSDMTGHAKPPARRDHLWVLVVIAACVVLEVWASWVTIGSVSGFPVIGGKHGLPTDWTLAVSAEAYWGYALYSWLAAAPGPRSRAFAMWSAAAVFLLSLAGQGSAHLIKPGHQPPAVLVVFVTSLPVLVLALIAVLVHLRQADREEALQAAQAAEEAGRQAAAERAEADERAWLRAEIERMSAAHETAMSDLRDALASDLDAEREARESAQDALEEALRENAQALSRAEALERKLATLSAQGERGKPARGGRAASGTADADLTNELRALMELKADPDLCKPRMGGELARRLGIGASTGRRLHGSLTDNGALSEYAESLIGPLGERPQ